MKELALRLQFSYAKSMMSDVVTTSMQNALESDDRLGKIRAAFVCMRLARTEGGDVERKPDRAVIQAHFQPLSDGLSKMLNPNDLPCALAASWALAWIGERQLLVNPPEPEMILSLYQVWRRIKSNGQAHYPTWALTTQQLLPRDTFKKDVWGDCDSFLRQAVASEVKYWQTGPPHSALIVGWYRRSPWSDDELVEQIGKRIEGRPSSINPIFRKLLKNLGDAGQRVLQEWESKHAQREAARSAMNAVKS
jgi:hypothetical protein